jgi:hypothetical protein
VTIPTSNRLANSCSLLQWLVLFFAFGCGGPVDGHHSGGAGLAWALAQKPEVQVQITRAGMAEDAWVNTAVARWRSEMGLQVHVLRPGEALKSGRARVVIGCVGDAAVDALLEYLEVGIRETHWAYGNLAVPRAGAWLVATFKDPLGDGLPVTLLCADNEKMLALGLKRLQPGTFPVLRMYRGGFPVMEAELNSLGKIRRDRWYDCRPWHLQPKDVVSRRSQRYKHWSIRSTGDCTDADLHSYVEATDRTFQALGLWSGWVPPESLTLFAQDSAHQWRLSDNPDAWAQVDPLGNAIQALILPGHGGDGGAQAGRVYVETQLGPAPWAWLAEAAAIQASGIYWGVPLDQWWATLARLGEIPTPSELISGQGLQGVSPHMVAPLRALLVQVVLDQDSRQLLRLWKEGEHTSDWKPWFAAFGDRLGMFAAPPREGPKSPNVSQWQPSLGASLQGGLDPDGPGLASSFHGMRLQDLAEAQAQSVAYTLSVVSQPHSPLVRARPLRPSVALADVRGEPLLLASIAKARALNFTTALELEIWATPSGVLLQDLIWPSSQQLNIFFKAYNRGALHAALFSSLAGVDLLCLGDGMGEVVRTEAREEERQDSVRMAILELRSRSWMRLIQSLRPAFNGSMTLAVSGLGMVSQTDVWSDLDAIGMNIFLGDRSLVQDLGGTPSGQEARWTRAFEKAEQASAGKPYVLWNVGLSVGGRSGQAADLAGVSAQGAQIGRVLQALGRALRGMGERGPRASFIAPLGLDELGEGLEVRFSAIRQGLEAYLGAQ